MNIALRISLAHTEQRKANKMSTPNYLFVYGTLKSGQPFHNKLTEMPGSYTFKGFGKTVDKVPLFCHPVYHFPFIPKRKDIGLQVYGEIYEMDDEMVKSLDLFENSPAIYEKVEHQIETVSDKEYKLATNTSHVESIEHKQNGVNPKTTPSTMKCFIYMVKYYPEEVFDKMDFLSNYDSSIATLIKPPEVPEDDQLDQITADQVYQWLVQGCEAVEKLKIVSSGVTE